MRTLTSSIALMVIFAGSVAHAAGPEPTPVTPFVAAPAPVSSWEGGYVGAQLGYAYGDFEFDLDTFDNDSAIGGLNAGYLWNIADKWYLGPEFQYDWADISVSDPGTNNTATFEEIARLKLLLGYELGDGMLYGSAGIAYGSLDSFGAVFDGFDGSDTSYVVGAGYDYRIAQNWTLGGEYMFHRFTGIGDQGGDVDVNTLQLKTTFRF